MQLPIYQVDAFTDQLFAGNPAAICPLAAWLPDAQMQAIAAENNLSETAFFVPENGGFHLRWFTPAAEVDLCGHATLAAAHILFTELNHPAEDIHFSSRKGPLRVSRSSQGYAMDFPADSPEAIAPPALIETALGQVPLATLRGADDYLVILADEKTVQDLRPDFRLLAQLPSRGLIVSAPGVDYDFVSRGFFPQVGIDEDPVTGSAHTLLMPYWAARLGKRQLRARQISARGGDLLCTLVDDRVILEGQATTYLRGEIRLPDL